MRKRVTSVHEAVGTFVGVNAGSSSAATAAQGRARPRHCEPPSIARGARQRASSSSPPALVILFESDSKDRRRASTCGQLDVLGTPRRCGKMCNIRPPSRSGESAAPLRRSTQMRHHGDAHRQARARRDRLLAVVQASDPKRLQLPLSTSMSSPPHAPPSSPYPYPSSATPSTGNANLCSAAIAAISAA